MLKNPWFYFGCAAVVMALGFILLLMDSPTGSGDRQKGLAWLRERAEVIVAVQSDDQAQRLNQRIPYSKEVRAYCGTSYDVLRRDKTGAQYACLKHISTDLHKQRIETLKSQIATFEKGNCRAFLKSQESDFPDFRRAYLQAYFQDKGQCAPLNRHWALGEWHRLSTDWYAAARISDAYWRGELVEKNEGTAWHYAYKALVQAYTDYAGPYDDEWLYFLSKDSDLDLAEGLWGMSYLELRQNFAWWLEGPWELSEPLIEMRELLRRLMSDETGNAAAALAQKWWDDDVRLKDASALLSIAAERSGRGELYFLKYQWDLENKGTSPWLGGVFDASKSNDGWWGAADRPCIIFANLTKAAEFGSDAAVIEVARILATFERPENADQARYNNLLSRLIKEQEQRQLKFGTPAEEMLDAFKATPAFQSGPNGSTAYRQLAPLYCHTLLGIY